MIDGLRRLIGAELVLTDESSRLAAGTDFITKRGFPEAVVRPASSEQIAAVLGFAAEHEIAVVPRGAGTNLSGGMAPGSQSLVLDLSGMNRIVDVDPQARVAIVQPGVINADLKARVARDGLLYAPDPASTPISTIGGNIAENAGGPGCIKYGVTFHHVRWLEVALTDGRLVTFADDDEADLLGVTIGSEGILGVVTQAGLNLLPKPEARWTAMAAFDRVEDAALTVSQIIAAGIQPAAIEICDRRMIDICEAHLPSGYPRNREAVLFAELDGDAEAVARDAPELEHILRGRDRNLRVALDEADRSALWAGRLAAFHAFKATGKEFYVCDATVPRQRLPEMIARGHQIAASRGLDLATVGHAGDGNMHPVILYEREELQTVYAAASEVAEAALELGGTLTGEHGVGTAKVAQMDRCFCPAELAAFRAIKRAFDPRAVLNPGVMLQPPAAGEPELELFGQAVAAAVAGGGQPPTPPPEPDPPGDEQISVDVENMTLTAGAAASCRDAAAAAERAGLSCPTMQADGLVGPLIEQAGNRQPARAALLGVEAVLPGGQHARFGSSAMKDVAGLDAKRLLAGGRRAFGEVSRVTLKATPRRR